MFEISQEETETPIDWEKAMSEFEGDSEFILHLLESFCNSFDERVKTLESLSGDRSGELRRTIHKLKGSAGNLYAFKLFEITRTWELNILQEKENHDKDFLKMVQKEGSRIANFLDEKKGTTG